MDKKFKDMVERLTKNEANIICKECGTEMVPLEFVLRKGECVLCKTKRELGVN